MVPIHEGTATGGVGYSFQEFRSRFLEICAEHRDSARALAFAFLLFDVDSPEFTKMLRDPDYWQALDRISGKYLTVFTLQSRAPRSDHRYEFRWMGSVGPVQDPDTKLQLMLRSYFGLTDRVQLPAVLLFQVDKGAVSGYCLVELQARDIESAFNEIRDLLRDLAEALGKSVERGKNEAGILFEAITSRLRKRKAVRAVKTGLKVLSELKDVAGLAGGLV